MRTISVDAVSKEAIEAVFRYSHTTLKPFYIAIDKAQIDYNSGYVMTTQELINLVREYRKIYYNANIALSRKNCGPGFVDENDLTSTWKTLETDCRLGVQLLHLNFSNLKLPRDIIHSKYAQAVKYAKMLSPNIEIEFGSPGLRSQDLSSEILFFKGICTPSYCNLFTGTLIKDGKQLGTFVRDKIINSIYSLKENNIGVKESHVDFSTTEQILLRKDYIDCIEIGEELAIAQNTLIMQKSFQQGMSLEKLSSMAMKNKEWKKLLQFENPDDPDLCLQLTLHHYLSTAEGNRIWNKLDIKEEVINRMINILDRYVVNFL